MLNAKGDGDYHNPACATCAEPFFGGKRQLVCDDCVRESERLIDLADGRYAVKFPYARVTEQTLAMAIPRTFQRRVDAQGGLIKFAIEPKDGFGTMRADSPAIEKVLPVEVAMLRSRGLVLSDYVIFQVK